ncbi:MAG: hypothetical protein M1822_001739 [Bathelium mastoideum]|nr:MAG: hypothetical protein M1822_001739 [Bathelium mastoideum]
MSDYGDDDYDDYDLDYDYIYVEDEFGAADDLAEHAIASPPYTFYEYEAEQDTYDPYAYFNDIEYTSDGYFDDIAENGKLATPNRLRQKLKDASGVKAGQKRKAPISSSHAQQPAKKKARMATQETAEEDLPPTVIWVPWSERPGIVGHKSETKSTAATGPFALLADWRDRIGKFKPDVGKSKAVNEVVIIDLSDVDEDEDGEGVNDDYEDNGEEAVDEQAFQENLKRALGEKLVASGMGEGMDQDTLLRYAMRMLSNEGNSDDIAGELATNLLGKATEGPEAAGISQWLGQQGVDLERDDDEESDWQTETGEAPEANAFTAISPPPALPSARPPPTPESTQSPNGSGKAPKPVDAAAPPIVPRAVEPVIPVSQGQSAPKSRKRKAEAPKRRNPGDIDEDLAVEPPPAKRVASYAGPTASSRSKAVPTTAQSSKTGDRNAGKRS